MATSSPFDAGLRNVVDRLHAATTGLAGDRDENEIAEHTVALALTLTRSAEAAIGLGGLSSGYERFYSRSADAAAALTDAAVTELIESAGFMPVRARSGARAAGRSLRLAVIGTELRASGQVIGVLVVGRSRDYDNTEKQLLSMLGAYVARALDGAALRHRQQALEAALIELRAKVDQQAAHQAVSDEQVEAIERVEHAHDQAVEVLTAASSYVRSAQNLMDFYNHLARTFGELAGAEKVLFWRLTEKGTIVPIPGGYGLSASSLARLGPTRCAPTGNDLASRVVFKDLIFRANQSDDPAEFAYVLERLGVKSAISVPWRAGDERLGLLAAYDSSRPGGFSREDTWVLQKAGLAAGIVTLLWHAQEDLKKSVERLTKVDAARQLLLKNMTTVVEKERRRFVSELHDDALQKLTAAEMHAARLATSGGMINPEAQEALLRLLNDTETALRKLVFEVRPPALDEPGGLVLTIKDRVEMLATSGIKNELELDLPEELDHDSKALIFRQVSEALSNVERHSQATQVKISLRFVDGGVLGVITDNGRGFAVAEKSNLPGHLGLQALKERALMAGGRYKIESEPGAGARVEFWIPLNQ